MEREMLGNMFRYENGKLYKKHKQHKKWCCYNDNKPDIKGYILVSLNGRKYRLHRLVYLFHNPDWDIHDISNTNEIDHLNRIRHDCKIENLEIVTRKQNAENRGHMNGKLIRGVHKEIGKNKKPWMAYWPENGKQKKKYFVTEKEAIDYRAEMINIHYTHSPSQRPC